MTDSYVLGIDVGSRTLRAGLFNPNGDLVSIASTGYQIHQPHLGWAEQDAGVIWKALKKSIRACIRLTGVDGIGREIKALCLDGTAVSLVTANLNGQLLAPIIMWMDTRATQESERLSSTQCEWLNYTGGKLSPEWMLPKVLWIKNHRPDLYEKSFRIVELTDWLDFQLTGVWSASLTTLSAEWSYCTHLGGWPKTLLEQHGLEDLISRLPTLIIPPGEVIGTLSKPIAQELGLSPNILVAKGLMDSYAAALGLDIFRKGCMAVSIGTSSAYITLSKEPRFHEGLLGPIPDAFGYGKWVIQGGQTSAGAVIKWYMDQIGRNTTYSKMDKYASAIPPGSEGLLALDCWQGSRTPFRDPNARGALWGLHPKHTIYHIYRALLEAVAYGGQQILDTMSVIGVKPDVLTICGGGTRSLLLMQIHSDVMGLPLLLAAYPEVATLGAAMCATVAAGFHPDLESASHAMTRKGRLIEPNPTSHERYKAYYGEYCTGYPALSASFRNLAALQKADFTREQELSFSPSEFPRKKMEDC